MLFPSGSIFTTIAKPEYASVLVGRSHNQAINAFQRVSVWSLKNSLITSISALQGSGKTHLLYHLRYLSKKNKPPKNWVEIIAVNELINTVGERNLIDAKFIFNKLLGRNKYGFLNMLKENGYDISKFSEENQDPYVNGGLISEAVRYLNKTLNTPFSLIIALDGIDEYVRDVGQDSLIENRVKSMLINIRLILDLVDHTCIILAITEDVLRQMSTTIKEDPTFFRRYVPLMNFDGSNLEIGELTLDDTFQLCLKYRDRWISDQSEEIISEDKVKKYKSWNWPFEPQAVELAWLSSENRTPRSILRFFQEAENLLSENLYDKNITIYQMAEVIEKRSLEVNPPARKIIEYLIDHSYITKLIKPSVIKTCVEAFLPEDVILYDMEEDSFPDTVVTQLSNDEHKVLFFFSTISHDNNLRQDDILSLIKPQKSYDGKGMGLVVPCMEYDESLKRKFSHFYRETGYIHSGNNIFIHLLDDRQKGYIKAFAMDLENDDLRWIVDHTCGPFGTYFSTMVEAIVERALRGD